LPVARRLLLTVLVGVVGIVVIAPATTAHAEPTASELQQQIDQASADLEKIVEQYNKVTEQLKASQAAAADVTARLASTQASLDAANVRVSQLAANVYKGGAISTMSVLLNTERGETFFDTLVSLEQIARGQRQEISGYTELRLRYDAQKTELDRLLGEQAAQQRNLATTRDRITTDLAKLNDLKRRVQASTPPPATSGGGTNPAPPYVAGRAGIAVRYAYGALGKPYEWAADGPGSYDCSGLTMAAWQAAGVSLPHNAEMQWYRVPHISRGALQPGDLVFYHNLGHVAIYVGGGKVIHAPTFGDVVKISSVDMSPPYGYGRPG
jgi:cell wall-associated NlpC family hydrolase